MKIRSLLIVTATILAIQSLHPALASPILINYSDIFPSTVEDFEDEPLGIFPSPGIFDTFAFSANNPAISDLGTICRTGGQCLTANDLVTGGSRIFSDFHPGTTAFGVRLAWVNQDQFETLKVTVVGSMTTRIFSGFGAAGLTTTLAFADVSGIQRILFDISDLPGPFLSNYSFNDVITSTGPAPNPVPLPATGWLLIVSFGAMFAMLRRSTGKYAMVQQIYS